MPSFEVRNIKSIRIEAHNISAEALTIEEHGGKGWRVISNEDRRESLKNAFRILEIVIHKQGGGGDEVHLWSHPERQLHYIIERMKQERDIWEGKEPQDLTTKDCTCQEGGRV